MWRLSVAVSVMALLVLAPAGCKRKKKTRAVEDANDGQLVSILNAADPRAAVQLTRGFHSIENDSWRWTAKDFSVTLRRPTGAEQKGATLEVKLTVPDAVFSRVGPQTLSAKVGGFALEPEHFTKAGDYTYTRDVPATALARETVAIDFSVDKAIPPGDQDVRELAIIVSTVGLLPK
jgi:hypothetical protein